MSVSRVRGRGDREGKDVSKGCIGGWVSAVGSWGPSH